MHHNNTRFFALSFMLTSIFTNVAVADTVTKMLHVDIISGSLAGQMGDAVFSYDTSRANGRGNETIDGNAIEFKFLGQIIKGKPKIQLINGKFKEVLWVNTLKNPQGQNFNFGFNDGFNRDQFNRGEESFIQEGKSYFGYLGANTYVDGAGIISYDNIGRRESGERGLKNFLEFSIENQSIKFVANDFNKLSLEVQEGQKPALLISLKDDRAKRLYKLTDHAIGQRLHLSINGEEFSSPTIQSPMGATTLITNVPLHASMQLIEEFATKGR